MMLAGSARADVFDTTLASPNANAATGNPNTGTGSGNNPSWYNGSGNPQGGWTVGTDNGIEVGLRAKYRGVDAVIHSTTDDYDVLPGSGALALWNYEFSIDLQPNGRGSLTLADIAANTILTVTDLDTGDTATIKPLTYWNDSTGFGSGGAAGVTSTGKDKPATATDWGIQNSENLGFGDSPLAGLFNPNAAHTYEFDLAVKDVTGTTLASTDMEVHVTPEPTSIILFGTMLLAVFVVTRRRRTA